MSKVIGIVAIIMASVMVLLSIPVIVMQFMFSMPQEMANKTVCFLAPELTWSDKMSDVTKCFGTPVESGIYSDITGTKTNKYITEYENHKMEVNAERNTFPHPTNVFDYYFAIQCTDEKDMQKVFDDCFNQIVEDNANETKFTYETVNLDDGAIIVDDDGEEIEVHEIANDEIWFSINYGATGIHYELSQTNDYRVILRAYCIA
ncbi:MAG: hypothetical protein IKW45_02400 [Clostridia bacterium]|nr:hypothetical protein [Clostridia bacterium]